ncbi:RNA polymerase sigma-70 factor [Bacteroides sp. GM023]|uniref:RNA polymerase sigma-70 factor n=1 Tax=Bacteroides sp. GM023 TaxID=2723058 RepID=UPI00168BF0BB|nr:RNA polymerase sigma-70 factor [Bacteroides sp. GM023]MBD3592052.1 RNA polymerase sigma-70 factor [Bacteroides sp. GM023]
MEHTETLIIEQLKLGNEDAWQYIYDHHYALLCHIANSYVKDQFVAETIVGDTIFHVWEIRETLEISVSIRSYLLRAVRNRCINYFNSEREKREIAFSALMPDEISDDKIILTDSHPLGMLLERELEEEIYKAIDKLPDECRRVFDKSRFEGKSYEEISQDLGISINTVKYHIKNALALLQKHLSKYLVTLFLFFFS